MTRLLSLLALMAAGAVATMAGESIVGSEPNEMSSKSGYGSSGSSSGSGYGSSPPASGYGSSPPASGSSSAVSSGANGATVVTTTTTTVVVIGSTMGGTSGWVQQNQPMKGSGMNHQIVVGGSAGLIFSPSTINAAVGDMVTFTFMSQNHTLTQSTFNTPCVKMDGGMDSSFMPNPNNTVSPAPQFQMQVMSMGPTWFYCKQKTHCGKGMTFSINPSAAKTNAAFNAAAIAQNGTAGGVSPPAAAAAAPPMASSMAASPYAAPPAVAAAPPAVATQPAGNSIISGSGNSNNGVCSCSCLCGASSFPAMAGIGAFGGMSGSIPMN